MWVPSTSTATGHGTVGATPFNYSQTTYGNGHTIQAHCAIRIFVDKNDIVTGWDNDGNVAGCSRYANKLQQSSPRLIGAKFPQANEKTLAAMAECKSKRLSGELKTYVQSAKCSNPRMIRAFQDAGYPYMDIIELYAAKRIELAKNVDEKKITEEEYEISNKEFVSQLIEKEKERDTN